MNQFSLRLESLSGIGNLAVTATAGYLLSGDIFKDINLLTASPSCEDQAMYVTKLIMDLINSPSTGFDYDINVTEVMNKLTGGLNAK